MFAWARDEDSEINVLTPSQELTHKLIQNQTIDIKVTKHNLFSARGLPESEWVKVLQGKAVDLNIIISVIHSTVTDNRVTETGTLNSTLDIQNRPRLSGTMGIGLSRTVHSSTQCGSSTPTESQNSFNMVSTSPLTLHLPTHEGKTASSTLTKQSIAGLDPLTMCHLTSSRSLDFLKCNTSSVKQQETKVCRGISEECPHGKVRTCAGCSIKESMGSRHPSVSTDMFALDVERRDMLKRNVQAKRLEWFHMRGERPKHARKYLWKIDNEELGLTAGYSLTAKPLLCPSPLAENDPVRQAMISDQPDLFKIICKIGINTFEKLLTHHPNRTFVDSVLVRLREGFWPFADMTKEGYPKSWDGSWHPPKSVQERDFLEEQVQTKIAKCFSESFRMELLPGMYSPLVHSVPKPDSDTMQLVVDHSSGDFSPNSMITWEDIAGVLLRLTVRSNVKPKCGNNSSESLHVFLF